MGRSEGTGIFGKLENVTTPMKKTCLSGTGVHMGLQGGRNSEGQHMKERRLRS